MRILDESPLSHSIIQHNIIVTYYQRLEEKNFLDNHILVHQGDCTIFKLFINKIITNCKFNDIVNRFVVSETLSSARAVT